MGTFRRGDADSGGRCADNLSTTLKVYLTSLDNGRVGRGGSDDGWSGVGDGLCG